MLNNFQLEVDPLTLLKKRQIDYLPLHFKTTSIDDTYSESIKNWVLNNLQHRFCIVKIPKINREDKLKVITLIGFEVQKELTYFMLACPYTRSR